MPTRSRTGTLEQKDIIEQIVYLKNKLNNTTDAETINNINLQIQLLELKKN
jgi:hypothetical protein